MFKQLVNRWWLVVLSLSIVVAMSMVALEALKARAAVLTASSTAPSSTVQAASEPFGYGMVMANPGSVYPGWIGFNWLMVFDPFSSASYNVLQRLKVTVSDAADLPALRARVIEQLRLSGAGAFQIGNEPNLSSEWGAPPDAAAYRQVLCAAYEAIKQTEPHVVVVSGGLAPTGRVPGYWDQHPGHDGLKQDEREFLKEFLAAGGGSCLDVLGYNAMGFRASYAAVPDVDGGTPDTNCANGLCFRSIEKAHDILVTYGLGDKPVWATEVGWLTAPPAYCQSDPRWPSRIWQIVSPQQQSDNLVGAFRYARFTWPWLRAMFVFNFNFDSAPYYDECEQMRYYSVENRPAYFGLWQMSKRFLQSYLPLVRK